MRRYRQLLGYATPYWHGWLLIILVTLLSTGLTLLQPWPLQIVVDHLLGHKGGPGPLSQVLDALPGAGSDQGLLAWAVLGGLLIFAASGALEVVLTMLWVRVGQRMVYDLAEDLFGHIQRRSLLFHSRNAVGDLLSRITGDTWAVHTVVDTLLFAPLHALITITGLLVIMWQLDATLTLIALAVVPFMVAVSLLMGKRVRIAARERRRIAGSIYSHVQQTLAGMPVVQLFAQEERVQERFVEITGAAIRAERRSVLATNLNSLASGLVTTLATAAILWIGAGYALAGRLTPGTILVFLSYLGMLQGQLKVFTGMYTALQGAGAGVDRVMEILEEEQEVRDRPQARPLPPDTTGHVRLENVSFGYEPDKAVLCDVSLEALPGQTIAIVGPTGAGKSTLVSLVARLFDPWTGKVTVDGHNIRDVQLRSLRGQVALVLQEPFLLPISVAENIAYGRPYATPMRIEAAAKAAKAHDFIVRLPQGYATTVGERGATLSGGEKQRISIARALLKDAPILVLDEPTSALDANTEASLLEALETLKRGRTTFIIAHRLSTIRNADLIAVMHEGRIVEIGSHHQLISHGGFYARLYNAQMHIQRPVVGIAS